MKKILNESIIKKFKNNKTYIDGEDEYVFKCSPSQKHVCYIDKNCDDFYSRVKFKKRDNNKIMTGHCEEIKIGKPFYGDFSVSTSDNSDWVFYEWSTGYFYSDNSFKVDDFMEYSFDGSFFKTTDGIFIYDITNDKVYINFEGLHEINYNVDIKEQVSHYVGLQQLKIKYLGEVCKRMIASSIQGAGYEVCEFDISNSFKINNYIRENNLTNEKDALYFAMNIKKDYKKYERFMSKKRNKLLEYVDNFRNTMAKLIENNNTRKRIRNNNK